MRSCSTAATRVQVRIAQWRGGIQVEMHATFDAPHGGQVAHLRDVGGLARPGRSGAGPRHHQQPLPGWCIRRVARTIGQQRLQSGQLGRVQSATAQSTRCTKRLATPRIAGTNACNCVEQLGKPEIANGRDRPAAAVSRQDFRARITQRRLVQWRRELGHIALVAR